ncbi:MAG TPA: radical SAM protein [Candidatus Hydrogenedentes bacterium]|nr:radical SAM protein [Candidatus Hydrogenedentota bacterium]
MKIALINPGSPRALRKENLGLAYLSAVLKNNGHKTLIIDEIARQNVAGCLEEFKPDVAAISFMTMFAARAYAIADDIRRRRGIPVVMGGAHPTALPAEAIEHCDVVFRGEAEHAFAEALSRGCMEGVIDCVPPDNLDALPLPDRAALDLEFYARGGEELAGLSCRTLGVITSRGCPYRCVFCANAMRQAALRFHSPERVIEEIRYLADRHAVAGVAFYDELMATDLDRFQAICEALVATGLNRLRWECQMHPRTVRPDLLPLMKRAGCVQVGIGFESGSQRILDAIRKNTVVEENLAVARLVREAGLRLRGCFVFGMPGETPEDIAATEKFMRDARPDFASIHFLTPFPGTPIYDANADRIRAMNIPWDTFTAGDPDTFMCNEAIPREEQKRLYESLCARQAFRNYSWFGMIRRAFRNPRHALHVAGKLIR